MVLKPIFEINPLADIAEKARVGSKYLLPTQVDVRNYGISQSKARRAFAFWAAEVVRFAAAVSPEIAMAALTPRARK